MRFLRRRAPLIVAAIGLALVASACAADSGSTVGGGASPGGGEQIGVAPSPAGQPGASGNGDVPPQPATVPEILDFEAALVGGGTLAGAELAGAPVAVWFWAPW
jgi:hypothetical protein